MPIKHVEGNLLDFPSNTNVICHCCNTLGGVFGAGIAKQIAEEYPVALEEDILAAKEKRNVLGGFSGVRLSNGKMIINLYGQAEVGIGKRRLDYEAIYCALEALKDKLEQAHTEGRIYHLGIPYGIGCGLAGGAWSIVEAMIKDLFENSPVNVTIVKLKQKNLDNPAKSARLNP